jgi:hypothetical protein
MHAAAGRANPVLHGGEGYIVFDSSGGEGIGEVQVQVCVRWRSGRRAAGR